MLVGGRISGHRADGLREDPSTLPSARLATAGDAIREVLVSAKSPRLVAALAPILVWNIDGLSLHTVHNDLIKLGLGHRLGGLVDPGLSPREVGPSCYCAAMLLSLLWACGSANPGQKAADSGSDPVDSADTDADTDTDTDTDTNTLPDTGDCDTGTRTDPEVDTGTAVPTHFEGYPNLDAPWATWTGAVLERLSGRKVDIDITGDGVPDTVTGDYEGRLDIHASYEAGTSNSWETHAGIADWSKQCCRGELSPDVTGDGFPDAVVSFLDFEVGDFGVDGYPAYVNVYAGPITNVRSVWTLTSDYGDALGGTRCGADTDGDGVDEVYTDDNNGAYAFEVYPGVVTVAEADKTWTADCDRYMWVACHGDLTGDGLDDIDLTATGFGTLGASRVSFLIDPTSTATYVKNAASATVLRGDQEVYGRFADGCDLNSDGQLDFVATTQAGYYQSVSVIYGPISGTRDAREGDWVGLSTDGDNYPGTDPLCIGDATGDGNPDLVIGATSTTTLSSTRRGAALLIPGPFYGEQDIADGPRLFGPSDGWIEGLATTPDIDGDGIPEIAFGGYSSSLGRAVWLVNSSTWVSGDDVR